jgi:hypothetical protein
MLTDCTFIGNSLVGGAGGNGGAGNSGGLGQLGGDGGDGGAALGGAIYNASGATLVMSNTAFSDNTVSGGTAGSGGAGSGIALPGTAGQPGAQSGANFFNAGTLLQSLISLSVQARSNEVLLAWPDVGNFLLQINTNLSNPGGWNVIESLPAPSGGIQTLTVTPTNSAAFYRLRSQ